MFDSTETATPEPLAQARAAAHAQVDAAFDEAETQAADDADGPRRYLAAAVAGATAWAAISQRATAASAVTAVDVQRLGGIRPSHPCGGGELVPQRRAQQTVAARRGHPPAPPDLVPA